MKGFMRGWLFFVGSRFVVLFLSPGSLSSRSHLPAPPTGTSFLQGVSNRRESTGLVDPIIHAAPLVVTTSVVMGYSPNYQPGEIYALRS